MLTVIAPFQIYLLFLLNDGILVFEFALSQGTYLSDLILRSLIHHLMYHIYSFQMIAYCFMKPQRMIKELVHHV